MALAHRDSATWRPVVDPIRWPDSESEPPDGRLEPRAGRGNDKGPTVAH
jgi:hypothetical protein